MREVLKLILSRALRGLGYELRKVKRRQTQEERCAAYIGKEGVKKSTFLQGVMSTILAQNARNGRRLAIVQVGANDGVTEDPVFHFAMEHKEATSLFLIEPQTDIVQLLKQNYADHDAATIANIAIGPVGLLKLYRIGPDLHHYYKGIIASGVTSANREYVERKAHLLLPRHVLKREQSRGVDIVEVIEVESMGLSGACERYGVSRQADWLQIDVEGFDDTVIYAADIDTLQPLVVNYEVCHLSEERYRQLGMFLDSRGYTRYKWSDSDECAIYCDIAANLRKHPGNSR